MWQDIPKRSLSVPHKVFQQKSKETPRKIKMTSSKQNTLVLFLKEDHPHAKPKLINVAFWQAHPLYDFAESVDLITLK